MKLKINRAQQRELADATCNFEIPYYDVMGGECIETMASSLDFECVTEDSNESEDEYLDCDVPVADSELITFDDSCIEKEWICGGWNFVTWKGFTDPSVSG